MNLLGLLKNLRIIWKKKDTNNLQLIFHTLQEQKRKDIEAKLEREAREDQERARAERGALFEKRRQKQQQMKQLEQKLERVQSVSFILQGNFYCVKLIILNNACN